MSAADRFRAAARDRDVSRAAREFAENIRLYNPIGAEPLTGREAVTSALQALDAVFDEFEHLRVLTSAHPADDLNTENLNTENLNTENQGTQKQDTQKQDTQKQDTEIQAVMFRARIGDQVIEGLDLLEVSHDDKIITFTVFARPLSALQALGQAMARRPAAS